MSEQHSEPAADGRPLWLGMALASMLVVMRAERGLLGAGPVGVLQWGRYLAPELAVGAVFVGVWWMIPVRRRPTWALVLVAGLPLAVAVAGQQYFVATGTALHLGLIAYTLKHFGELGGLIGSGVKSDLLMRCLLGLALVGGAIILARTRAWEPRRSRARGLLGALLGGVVYVVAIPPDARWPARHTLAVEPFVALPHVVVGVPDDPEGLYQAPHLTGSPRADPPHVLVVILESTRRDMITPYGPPEREKITPFLSSLSEQGVLVDDAYVTTSHTTKALVGLLCGMYPAPQMEISEPAHLPLRCLPHLLEEGGYRTGFFQSALGSFEQRRPLVTRMGFETIQTQEDLDAETFQPVGYVAMDEMALVEPVISFFAESDGPAFAAVLTSVPHHPYEVPEARGPAAVEGSPAAYAAAIHHVDRFAERLHAKLRDAGLLEQTLLVFVGDHGEAFGEHDRNQHDAVPYEEVVRVPWILLGERWVGRPRMIGGLRSQLDLVPTVLQVVGAPWEGRLPGKSLLDATGHGQVYTSCWFDEYCASIRAGASKVVYHYARREPEVFDLEDDADETQPRPPDAIARARIEGWLTLKSTIEAVYGRREPEKPVEVVQEPEPPPALRPQCMRTCVADVDPVREGLQYDCRVEEVAPDGARTVVPHCDARRKVPPGAPACFFGRTDDQLPQYCAERGFNMELRLRRVSPAAPGAVLDARCRLAADPSTCVPERLLRR